MDIEWYKQRKLQDLQIAVIQMALDEKDIQNILWSLVRSDWETIWANDRISCDSCKQSIHRREIAYTEDYRNFCHTCSLQEEDKICQRCGEIFLAKTFSFLYTCHLCQSGICQICKKASLPSDCSPSWIRVICLDCQTVLRLANTWEKQELSKLSSHKSRCQNGQVSLRAWVETLQDFSWKCAYCQLRPYEQLEHFIPVCKDGLHAANNCVPACKICNDAKGHKLPAKVSSIPKEAIDRVQKYLQTR